jgi:hypothetical protein
LFYFDTAYIGQPLTFGPHSSIFDFLPEELERALGEFIDFYNNNRLHESLNNLAPADVYFNRGAKILKQREEIKQKTILQRRINHLLQIQNQSLSFI